MLGFLANVVNTYIASIFRCDAGFFGEYCVPSKALPMTLREDFEHGIQSDLWHEVYGADSSDICDTVVSGKALTFYKVLFRISFVLSY